ncbi:MAG: NAD(P)-dependent dehydrogenase, partial [Pseudomonas farsensis]
MPSKPQDQFTLQNPLTQYPHPPFPAQGQAAPGLDALMEPKPDHGEDTYKGFGRLAGRRALIT